MVVLAASARVDADDVLRIRWAEPPADGTALLLRHDAAETTVPFDGDAADLAGLDLADGTWSVHLPDGDVLTTDPGFSLDGMAHYARRPRTRALRAFRTPSGGLRLDVRTVEPHAEVTAVHPGEEELVVEGYFAFGAAPATAEFTAVRRKTDHTVVGEVSVTGDRWRAGLRTTAFAMESERGFWDLRLGGLDVATWLDDIPHKKRKVVFPARHVQRETDRVRVRAYYTDDDLLAIAATVVTNAETT